MQFSQGHALVVGVGSYAYAPHLDVPAVVDDARALAQVLSDERFCGYPPSQIALLTGRHATRAQLRAHTAALGRRCPPDGTAVVFYCGHGAFDAAGTYYLTTSDTRFQAGKVVAGTALSHAELLEDLRQLNAARTLVILNACHAGSVAPTLDVSDAATASVPDETSSALLAVGSGCVVITACRANQRSYVGEGRLTWFTQVLLEGLLGKGTTPHAGFVSVFDLYTHVYEVVRATIDAHYGAVQEPELTMLQGVGPFPVALYRGATTLGVTTPEPAPSGSVRTLTPEESRAAYQRIVSVGQGVAVGGDVTGTVVDIGPHSAMSAPVTINAPISSGIVVGANLGGTIVNKVERTSPEPQQPVALENVLSETRRTAEHVRATGDTDRADDLAAAVMALELAAKARAEGRTERAQAKIEEARAIVTRLAASNPILQALLALLNRV